MSWQNELPPKSDYEFVECVGRTVTIRDLNLGKISVTNDAERVVADLMRKGILAPGMKLMYYDSNRDLDEITFDENGFTGLKAGVPR